MLSLVQPLHFHVQIMDNIVPLQVTKSITSEVKYMENMIDSSKKSASVGDVLRFWRKLQKRSQMDLAYETGISPKHLSFVENGRSQPSRNLILRLASSLQLPFRHSNNLLTVAGYSSEFSEEPFSSENMGLIRMAQERMIKSHEPFPAFVINSEYTLLMKNAGYTQLVERLVGEEVANKYDNVYRMMFAEDGLCQYVVDWENIQKFVLGRLWEEAVITQNQRLISLYEEIAPDSNQKYPSRSDQDSGLPVMILTFEKDGVRASFFTTITTLGTPLDLTTQELRIESLFPADDQTIRLFDSI